MPGSPESCSALSASARFRKAVEATPPEAAAAGAGESRSRSQGAGASAPFPGCGVIHPAWPGRAAQRGPCVSIPGSPGAHLPDSGIEPAKGPRGQYPFFPRPLPFIYIPRSPAANQNEEGATRSQSGSGGGSIARPVPFSNRRLSCETQF